MTAKEDARWLDGEGRQYKMLWFLFNQLSKKKQDQFWKEWTGAVVTDSISEAVITQEEGPVRSP